MNRSRTTRKPAVLAMAGSVLLAACGFNGTDPDEDAERPTVQEADAAERGPDFATWEEAEVADSQPRPQMQLQVVLDQQRFGPGVIDGKEGISTTNALKGFQEANALPVTGEVDEATRQALARWRDVPATRVVRIPESWGTIAFQEVPDEPEDQAKMERLGYESLGEKLAERFHTTVEVLQQLNPGGRPAGSAPEPAPIGADGNVAEGVPAYPPRTRVTPTPLPSAGETAAQPDFRPGQLVRVPNVGFGIDRPPVSGDNAEWQRTLASLGVSGAQPDATKVVVDKSESWLKAYDESGKLLAMFTVTSGSSRDPLPLGEWGITGVGHNPPFRFDPDLFWDVPDNEEEQHLPPGPNGPVGVVWIDLTKEHYGIHGTPEPQTIGRTQSHGCVRLTNWDAARLGGMVSSETEVVFQA